MNDSVIINELYKYRKVNIFDCTLNISLYIKRKRVNVFDYTLSVFPEET